jgi:hypothetical protein
MGSVPSYIYKAIQSNEVGLGAAGTAQACQVSKPLSIGNSGRTIGYNQQDFGTNKNVAKRP